MATIPDTVVTHITTNWNPAVVCGSGSIPTVDVWGPEDVPNPRDYPEIITVGNERKLIMRRYQQNTLENRYYVVPLSVRLEEEAANTKTILDAVSDELIRILGIQVSGFAPGQWYDGPNNLTQSKGFYVKTFTLYLPQYGVSVSSGWTAAGTTSGYQDVIPATDSTYDLGSSTKHWAEVHLDKLLSDAGIAVYPSGVTYPWTFTAGTDGRYLFFTPAYTSAQPAFVLYGNASYGNRLQVYSAGNDKYLQLYHDDVDALLWTTSGKIKLFAGGDTDDYWYLSTAANIASFVPVEDKVHLIGSAALSADNVYADDFTNTSPFQVFTDAIGAVKRITPIADKSTLDYTSLPDWVRRVYRPEKGAAKDQLPPDNPNVWSVNRMVCIQWQALQQLTDALLLLANRVQALEAKLPAKGGAA
jgi:hypothetical protein